MTLWEEIKDVLGTVVPAVGLCLLAYNTWVTRRVEKNTNSLATRAEDNARAVGTAEGNLQGRLEQTAERKVEKENP